ncbi:hypothetical protein LCGC14_0380300 [marine sediment metagenome]|uniref:Uncharacterized protein n=1 Tax=marine sediment metagenome TaxID=412755 RepID=A0A0F9T8B1_9ZZZZ
MTRIHTLGICLILLIPFSVAGAVTLPGSFDEPCPTSGPQFHQDVCAGVNAINDALEATISDVTTLQGNVTSIENRTTIAEAHILNHHTVTEPEVDVLQANATLQQIELGALEIDIGTLNSTLFFVNGTAKVPSISIQERFASSPVFNAGELGNVIVECNSDETVLGGGYSLALNSVATAVIITSEKISGGDYTIEGRNIGTDPNRIDAIAYCATLSASE